MTQKSLFSATFFLHNLICNQTIKSELSEPSGKAEMEGLGAGKQHFLLVPLGVSSLAQPLSSAPFCPDWIFAIIAGGLPALTVADMAGLFFPPVLMKKCPSWGCFRVLTQSWGEEGEVPVWCQLCSPWGAPALAAPLASVSPSCLLPGMSDKWRKLG